MRRFSPKEIGDLYELRQVLEVFAVQKAEITPELLGNLEESVQRTRELLSANKKQEFIEEDTRFHGLIAKATGNQPLCAVLENIQNQIWLSRRASYDLSSSTAPDYHDAILKALEDSDSDKAQQVMRAHIRNVRARLVQALEHKAPAGASLQ